MAIKINDKVKATLLDGSTYIGTLTDICLGIDTDNPTEASIILSDDISSEKTYGNVHIWCNGLKCIEVIKENIETERKFYYEVYNNEHTFYCCVDAHVEAENIPDLLGLSDHGLFNPSYRAREITKEEYEKNADVEVEPNE